jgi:hypothetical protein
MVGHSRGMLLTLPKSNRLALKTILFVHGRVPQASLTFMSKVRVYLSGATYSCPLQGVAFDLFFKY